MAKFFYAGLIVLALMGGCEGCQGGYLVQVNDSGSDAGFAYLYDVNLPDMEGQDSTQPASDAASQDLNVLDAAIADQNLVDVSSDAQVADSQLEDVTVEDANIVDAAVPDTLVTDSALADTNLADTNLIDTFQPDTAPTPECVAGSVSCVGDHLISCDALGFIAQDLRCADFGCNAALIPNACRACDPNATKQCLGDRAVICSAQGEIVTDQDCSFGCNVERGLCNVCAPGELSCIDDQVLTCGDDGLFAETPRDCPYGCGLHPVSDDAGVADAQAGTSDATESTILSCNACRPDTLRCEGEQSLSCDSAGEVAELLDCAFGCNPSSGACRACDPNALHQCLAGQAVTCSSSGEIVASDDCVYGCDASDGTCDACDPDLAQQCIADDAVQCSGTGEILSQTPCGESQCNPIAGQCNACTPELDFCADSGDIMACELDGSIGSLVQTCSYGCAEPVPGNPICLACEPSTLSCHDSALVQCDAVGNIISSQACDYGCAQAVGDDRCMDCVPSTTACHADSSVVCSPDGYISTSTQCPYDCRASDGLCQACTPSSSACQGDDWVVCTAEGTPESTTNCSALGNACNVGVCTASGCDLDSSAREDQSCDDGLFCTAAATCQGGICTRTQTRVCTDDNNACTQDRCDATLDTCVYDSTAREGAACDDGQICTVSTTCQNGNCEGGTPLDCSDDNPCTEEHCDPDTGCTTPDPTALENSRCGDANAGEEKICCSGTCTDSDINNCGQCGTTCGDVGDCSAACLHYVCIAPDMLVVTELMINPSALDDADGEWIELFNPTSHDIDIQDWIIAVTGDTPHEISQTLVVPAGEYAVLTRNQTSLAACAIPHLAENIFVLGNGGDEVVISAPSCEIDRVKYESNFDTAGYSQQLSLDHYGDDNNDLNNWCNSPGPSDIANPNDPDDPLRMTCGGSSPYDFASPGAANAVCD